MKKANKNQTLALTTAETIERHATEMVIRKEITLEDGKVLPTRYATYYKGMILGAGGRLVNESKFVAHFSTPTNGRKALMTEETAKAEFAKMSESYQNLGKKSLATTLESVNKGERTISRVFWNFAKGTNVIETRVTSDNQKIIDVAGEITEVNGRPLAKEDALAFAKQLLAKTGEIKK